MLKVGVLFGGRSVEHEVSIISALQAIAKLDENKYEVIPIYMTKDGLLRTGHMLKEIDSFKDMDLLNRYSKEVNLVKKKSSFYLESKGLFKRNIKEVDFILPIVHGTNVEDGILQGYLKTIGIPFAFSNTYASSLAQDKVSQRAIYKSVGINISSSVTLFDYEIEEDENACFKKIEELKYPVIVKPAHLGSSIGIKIASDREELRVALGEAITYDNKILVEKVIEDMTELNISILGYDNNLECSAIEEVGFKKNLLSFEDKYINGSKSKGMASAKRVVPAKIDSKLQKEIEDTALCAFKALGMSGLCRFDFIYSKKEKKLYLNEVNSIPGSLAFYLWEPLGKSYKKLLDEIINIALKEYKKEENKITIFKSNILSGISGIKGLKGSKGNKF